MDHHKAAIASHCTRNSLPNMRQSADFICRGQGGRGECRVPVCRTSEEVKSLELIRRNDDARLGKRRTPRELRTPFDR